MEGASGSDEERGGGVIYPAWYYRGFDEESAGVSEGDNFDQDFDEESASISEWSISDEESGIDEWKKSQNEERIFEPGDFLKGNDVSWSGVAQGRKDHSIFQGVTNYNYWEILRLRRKKKRTCIMTVVPAHWSRGAMEQLGLLLSRADRLKKIYLRLDDEHGGVNEFILLVFRGPFQGHSLEMFSLHGSDNLSLTLTEGNVRFIDGCLNGSSASIRHLDLRNLSLCGLFALSLRGTKLQSLTLVNVSTQEGHLSALLTALDTADLKLLRLENCAVTAAECALLASFLRDESSVLQVLSLRDHISTDISTGVFLRPANRIDDNCIDLLCESLQNNTMLTRLDLLSNELISNHGWKRFGRLLSDASSLDSISKSNHTIGYIAHEDIRRVDCWIEINCLINAAPPPPFPDGLPFTARKVRHKIANYLRMDGAFNAAPFGDFEDVRLMPRVLAFLAKERPNYCTRDCPASLYGREAYFTVSELYCVLKSWNMPTLFAFPSREKIQLTEEMDKLKKEIGRLRNTIEELNSENRCLQSKVESLGGMSHGAKRAKHDFLGLW